MGVTAEPISSHHESADDWDPRAPEVLADQTAAFDAMRARCPIAHSEFQGWTFFKHDDVLRTVLDHETFSNAVSTHLTVPNGMDPPEHTPHRQINEKYFTPSRMVEFEPRCRAVAQRLVARLPHHESIEVMEGFARTYSLEAQAEFMGWPDSMHAPLRDWVLRNHRATLARDREASAALAVDFDRYIRAELDQRRDAGPDSPQDVTAELTQDTVDGRPLTDEEIVSVVRNWTVGELSTIAAGVGSIIHYLAEHPDVQTDLRDARARDDRASIDAACDEILRIRPPLAANRRVATCPVDVGGRHIEAGERVTVLWASADRDEDVFGNPDAYRPQDNAEHNLLYGAGIHVCPGAPLARLELRVVIEEVLDATTSIEVSTDSEPVLAEFPATGFTSVEVVLH